MNFFEQYQDLNLMSGDLRSYISFGSGDLSDFGPNSGDWFEIGSNISFSIGRAEINDGRIDCGYDLNSFHAMINLERTLGSGSCIFHNYSGGSGEFAFGYLNSDIFYVGRPEDSGCGINIFHKINPPSRAILSFIRNNNSFSLGYYDPFSSGYIEQTIVLPEKSGYGHNLQIGDNGINGFNSARYTIYGASIMDYSAVGSGNNDLLRSLHLNTGEIGYYHRSLNVFNSNQSFSYENTSGTDRTSANTNYFPNWSISPVGFGVRQSNFPTGGRVFANGLEKTFTLANGVVAYTGMQKDDFVIYDGGSFTGTLKTNIIGYNYVEINHAPGASIVYDKDNKRISSINGNYISVGASSPIYLTRAFAPNQQSLFGIKLSNNLV